MEPEFEPRFRGYKIRFGYFEIMPMESGVYLNIINYDFRSFKSIPNRLGYKFMPMLLHVIKMYIEEVINWLNNNHSWLKNSRYYQEAIGIINKSPQITIDEAIRLIVIAKEIADLKRKIQLAKPLRA